VSPGRGLCDALITRLEESYRLWCVVVCDLETSRMRRPWPALGRGAKKKMVLSDLSCRSYWAIWLNRLLSNFCLAFLKLLVITDCWASIILKLSIPCISDQCIRLLNHWSEIHGMDKLKTKEETTW